MVCPPWCGPQAGCRELVLNALRAAKQSSDETARYLIAFVYGIIALSGAIFFTQLFHPWVLHLGIRWTHDADGDNRHAKPRSSQRPASCIPTGRAEIVTRVTRAVRMIV